MIVRALTWRGIEQLFVVKTIQYRAITESHAAVVVNGVEFPFDGVVSVWHINGKPFLVEFPDSVLNSYSAHQKLTTFLEKHGHRKTRSWPKTLW
jgi:hypothetical protein